MNQGKSFNWKQEAERLFFDERLSIVKVSDSLGISIKSISAHLNSLPHYKSERERRKKANADRSGYYRNYRRKSRAAKNCAINYNACADTLKKDHITAVRILSRERFFR
jgi:hypothetical protein